MSLKDTFCSSPWMHMKISSDGRYGKCRWGEGFGSTQERHESIGNIEPITFFQENMAEFRKDILDGKSQELCSECYQVDRHDKVSGRQRQLLKSGIQLDHFEKTTLSSPMLDYFMKVDGSTTLKPIDWQIDLGNHCNSGCVFCHPDYSSSLASDFKKIGLIKEMPPRAWSENSEYVDSFVDALKETEHLSYLHFIGGETMITPAFRKILSKLIDAGINEHVSIGFTTNLTVWDDGIVSMLERFKSVNLGMSIECLHPVNDYLRYPSRIDDVKDISLKWIKLGEKLDWLMQFRITPTNLSIMHLDTLYDFAYDNNVTIESCNFLNDPAFMRPSTLPMDLRSTVISKLQDWISKHDDEHDRIINTRNPEITRSYLIQDAKSYVNYLRNEPDESDRLPDLVSYLKKMESLRKNSILDYLPEYEELLRTAGY